MHENLVCCEKMYLSSEWADHALKCSIFFPYNTLSYNTNIPQLPLIMIRVILVNIIIKIRRRGTMAFFLSRHSSSYLRCWVDNLCGNGHAVQSRTSLFVLFALTCLTVVQTMCSGLLGPWIGREHPHDVLLLPLCPRSELSARTLQPRSGPPIGCRGAHLSADWLTPRPHTLPMRAPWGEPSAHRPLWCQQPASPRPPCAVLR